MSKTSPHGFLLVNKPPGPTSHDVVSHIRRLLRIANNESQITKVGHTGTLDPFAEGLLIIAIGSATRLIEYTHTWNKTYRADILLGAVSDTDDPTGTIQHQSVQSQPTTQEINEALHRFIGQQQQLPPTFAAIKVQGKKLYELARQGSVVPRLPRAITIHALTLQAYAYPRLTVEAAVSTGTYIRALARDLGQQLGTGAYLTALRRTAIGPFDISAASKPNELGGTELFRRLRPAHELLQDLPRVSLPAANVAQFIAGRAVEGRGERETLPGPVAVVSSDGTLLGIGRVGAGQIQPEKVLHPPLPDERPDSGLQPTKK